MANSIKTAISLEKALFEELEALAHDMEVSRSHLFSLAAQQFIQRHKSQEMLVQINEAHDDLPDPGEEALQKRRRTKHRELVKDQW